MRFPDFEHDWESKKLKDLSNIQRGASPRPITAKKWYDNENKKVGWVRIGDVTSSSKYLTKTEDYFSEEGVKKSRFLPKGSLIMSICATIGKPIVTGMDTCIHDGFVGFSELKNINKEFLYYYLNILEPKFISLSQTGSQANLNSDLVRNAEIGVPSIQEQEKIVNFISAVDKKHNILNKNLETQLSFKKYLMQQIFTQKLRFVDFNNSSWKDYKFKDLGTVKSGVGFSNKYQGHLDLDYNFYKVSDMNLKGNEKVMTRSNNTIDDNLLKDIGVKLIENPSIIFAKVGEAIFLNRKRIAKQPFLIDNNMMAFSPNENVDLEFMYYLATSINFGKYAQTGALPSYNASDIYSIKCKIPPIEEQKRIGKLLSLADNKIDFCSNQLNKTQEFKKGLLQQMFVVRINWRCNFKLAKSPSFNKHLLILKNKIIFIIIE